MFHQRSVTFAVAISMAAIFSVRAADPVDKPDWEEAVNLLANKNAPPKIDRERLKYVEFPENYDWNEQRRVLSQLGKIIAHIPEAYPALIKLMDDERYCLTLEHDQSAQNHSIGDICRDLVLESVAVSYEDLLPPLSGTKAEFYRFRHTFLPYGNTQLKALLVEQRREGKSLADLEIEACQWVLKELPTLTNNTDEQRRRSKAKIEGLIAELKSSQKPFAITRFFWETRNPYRKENLDKEAGEDPFAAPAAKPDPFDPFK